MYRRIKKNLAYVYNEKLNYSERYYIHLIIFKIVKFLIFVWDHKYLRYALALMIFLVIFNIVTSIINYFALGLDIFLQATGVKQIILDFMSFLKEEYGFYITINN
jgi:hypothetical protein